MPRKYMAKSRHECRSCGVPLRRGRSNLRYCDNACKQAWYRLRKAARLAALFRAGQGVA